MLFSNSTNKTGLIEDIDFLCGTTSASYPLVQKVRNINNAYHDVTRIIWEAQDAWQFDDENRTDLPKITTSLTHGTGDYRVPALSTVIRHIKGIDIQDSQGNWQKLQAIDYNDITQAWDEYQDTAGMPMQYDLEGGYIRLKPAPSSAYVTTSSGMIIWISRDATEFTTASTTSVPGFATQFHKILSLSAAIDFTRDAGEQRLFIQMKDRLEKGLKEFYNARNVEKRISLRPYNKKFHRQYE